MTLFCTQQLKSERCARPAKGAFNLLIAAVAVFAWSSCVFLFAIVTAAGKAEAQITCPTVPAPPFGISLASPAPGVQCSSVTGTGSPSGNSATICVLNVNNSGAVEFSGQVPVPFGSPQCDPSQGFKFGGTVSTNSTTGSCNIDRCSGLSDGDRITMSSFFYPDDVALTYRNGALEPFVPVTSNQQSTNSRSRRIILNFLSRRADQITSNEPNLTERLGNGDSGTNGPITFAGQGTAQSNQLAFATGLRQIAQNRRLDKKNSSRDLSQKMALGVRNGTRKEPTQSGFDVWVKGVWSSLDNGSAENDLGLLFVGADYRFGSGLVVGLLAQFDWADEKDDNNNYEIDGRGWMVGPYMVARLHQNLIFDGRAAWGKSTNDVSPFKSYTDSFDGQRWLVKGQLTGDFKFSAIHFVPHVALIYFEEEQKAYTDSNGIAIGAQTVELGRLTFGPKISTTFRQLDGATISPFISIKGIWDFKSTDEVDIATGLAASGNDEFRGRTEAGITIKLPDGVSLSGEGFYDGIGASDYEAYGGSLKVAVPF